MIRERMVYVKRIEANEKWGLLYNLQRARNVPNSVSLFYSQFIVERVLESQCLDLRCGGAYLVAPCCVNFSDDRWSTMRDYLPRVVRPASRNHCTWTHRPSVQQLTDSLHFGRINCSRAPSPASLISLMIALKQPDCPSK